MKNLLSVILLCLFVLILIYFTLFYRKPEVSYINTTIKLVNNCELIDDSFMVISVPKGKKAYFIDGVAKMILEEDSYIRLEASSKYPGFSYNGVPKKVDNMVELVADCTKSDRLEGIFESLREQFNSEK